MACDCDQECEPNTGPEVFTRSASKVLGVRVSKGFAREFSKACSAAGCTQSDLIRVALSKLAKTSGDADQQYAALLDLLGVDPATATTSQIEDAIVAILEAHPPEGDAAGPEAADPTAAAADIPPPANPLAASKPAVAASKPRLALSATELAYCRAHNLTEAAFQAKKTGAVRLHGAERARPPAQVALAKGDVSKLSASERQYCTRTGTDRQEFADRKANAVRRA
jgi:hypothetical protein